MNLSIIRYMFGNVIKIEGIFFLIPAICGFIYREHTGMVYLALAVACFLLGLLFTIKKPGSLKFYTREGFLVTSTSWITVSVIGAIPFVITHEIPNYIDALFETVSGFTTTGASILPNPEVVSHASNLWRCFTHWIGGMGVLVFLLAIIPMTSGSDISIMKAESPGPSVGKLVPQIKKTTQFLYIIYFGISVLMFISLLIARMPIYDALCAVFGTAGTGGFGIKADSMGSYSPTIQWIITIFMIMYGINFNFYYFIIARMFKKAFVIEEVRAYLLIIMFAIITITYDIMSLYPSIIDAVRSSAFQVASIITTTGYSTCDFNMWPAYSKTLLVSLMFCGACAGSTGGGIKVSRFLILLKTIKKELNGILHPKSVKKIKLDQSLVEHVTLRNVNVFFVSFFIIFVLSLLLISTNEFDLETNFTAIAATMNNIGPGLSLVGPSSNYSMFSSLSKCILIFDMLAGRLELFPMLILFHPGMWREVFRRHSSK